MHQVSSITSTQILNELLASVEYSPASLRIAETSREDRTHRKGNKRYGELLRESVHFLVYLLLVCVISSAIKVY